MEKKPATIKEIAQRLNVSVSTVSRALHNHPSIGLRTRMQVQQLAAELGYEPNQAAISFKQGKTLSVGVILPNLGEQYFSIAINGIEDVATKNNYTVLIGQSHDRVDREMKIVDAMRRQRIDGLIVSLSKDTSTYEHFERLKTYKIPVVFFDRVPDLPDAYCVSCNLEKSSIELVNWLASNGHQRIGFIKGPDSITHSQQRLGGYLEGLKANSIGMQEELIVQSSLDKLSTQEAVEKLLSLQDRPTAIIAFNDYVALDAIQYSKSRGLKINRDIFFVSYANLPITSYLDDPPVASVEQFPYEQAEKATSILFQLIAAGGDDEHIPKKIKLESRVVVNVNMQAQKN